MLKATFIVPETQFSASSYILLINLPMVQETVVQSQVESYKRLKTWYLDTALLNTQHYKVVIKSKAEQSRGRSSTLPYTLL